jgi:hypothetical protein
MYSKIGPGHANHCKHFGRHAVFGSFGLGDVVSCLLQSCEFSSVHGQNLNYGKPLREDKRERIGEEVKPECKGIHYAIMTRLKGMLESETEEVKGKACESRQYCEVLESK